MIPVEEFVTNLVFVNLDGRPEDGAYGRVFDEEPPVVEPGAKIIGVKVPSGRYVPALSVVTTQDVADNLPLITDRYPYRNLNDGVVRVNVQLAEARQPQAIAR